MLTHLKFTNWRTLQNVSIDNLTPITVLIGANSSGKTNIIDALSFMRDALNTSPLQAFASRGSSRNVRTLGIPSTKPIELKLSFLPARNSKMLTYSFSEKESATDNFLEERESLSDESDLIWLETVDNSSHNIAKVRNDATAPYSEFELTNDLALSALGRTKLYPQLQQTFQFITQRWQLLDEHYMPNTKVPTNSGGDIFSIDRCADNVPIILDYMRKNHRKLYKRLLDDLQFLLGHISTIDTVRNDSETIFQVKEHIHKGTEAPTISGGTGRLIGFLAAYYVLSMRLPEQPGIVIMEEPDAGLNPLLMRQFVALLREYTDGDPLRQFIFTTHNPHFLDYLEPEEVRVVERDPETGYTTVSHVPNYLRETWLPDNTLGEAWLNRVMGGVPQE